MMSARLVGLVGVLLAVLGLVVFGLTKLDAFLQEADAAGYGRAQAEYQARALAANAALRATEQQAAARVAAIERASNAKQRDFEAAVAGAGRELERLRAQLASIAAAPGGGATGSDAAAAPGRDGGAAAAVVAGQCAGELIALAEAAEPVRRRLSTLQAYVLALGPSCVPSMAVSDVTK